MILGINDMVDPSISLVKNGKLLFYIEEERLNRIKHSHNIFPLKSIVSSGLNIFFSISVSMCYKIHNTALVAQLDRASGFGPEG